MLRAATILALAAAVGSAAPDDDLQPAASRFPASSGFEPHMQRLDGSGPYAPDDPVLDFNDYSLIEPKPGCFGVLYFGHTGAGKSSAIEATAFLKPGRIASEELNDNTAGYTQEADAFEVDLNEVTIIHYDTVGFGDGSVQGRGNIIKAAAKAREYIETDRATANVPLRRIYYVLSVEKYTWQCIADNLQFLKLAYGDNASCIDFIVNKCDKESCRTQSFFQQVADRLRDVKRAVFESRPDCKVLFTVMTGRFGPSQLFEDLILAGAENTEIRLDEPNFNCDYLELPRSIEERKEQIGLWKQRKATLNLIESTLKEKIASELTALNELRNQLGSLVKEQTDLQTNVKEAEKTLKNLSARLLPLDGDYPMPAEPSPESSPWSLLDIVVSGYPVLESLIIRAHDAVQTMSEPAMRHLTADGLIATVSDLLGKKNSLRFHVLDILSVVVAKLKKCDPELIPDGLHGVKFQELLNDRDSLNERIRQTTRKIPLNARPLKGLGENLQRLGGVTSQAMICAASGFVPIKTKFNELQKIQASLKKSEENLSEVKAKVARSKLLVENQKAILSATEGELDSNRRASEKLMSDIISSEAELKTLNDSQLAFDKLLGHAPSQEEPAAD